MRHTGPRQGSLTVRVQTTADSISGGDGEERPFRLLPFPQLNRKQSQQLRVRMGGSDARDLRKRTTGELK